MILRVLLTAVLLTAASFWILWKNPMFEFERPLSRTTPLADPARLETHVRALTRLQPPRDYMNFESLSKAGAFIENEFRGLGLEPRRQPVRSFGKEYFNVSVLLGPSEGDRLIIGAHYDVCGDQPGADDNASGVAGILELARLLGPEASKLKIPLELIAYTLEEPPHFGGSQMGSAVHARSLKESGQGVRLMMSIEMIGYYSDEPGSQKYPVPLMDLMYPDRGNFIGIIGRPQEWLLMRKLKRAFRAFGDIELATLNSPPIVPGVTLSDHRSFWEEGFHAVMVTDTAFMRNPHYHQKSDTPETLDYKRMAEVVNGLYGIAREMD